MYNINFKRIHIGKLVEKKVTESGIEISRIRKFFNCDENKISEMYTFSSMDTEILLRWSKLLDYDFFRIYTQHLILYAPPGSCKKGIHKKTQLPVFRKNIYTLEIIDFILEMIKTGAKTKAEVIEEYRIPKTTLYKWISKNTPENIL